MRNLWRRSRKQTDLEAELRHRRPEARAEFVQAISDRLSSSSIGRRWRLGQLGIAAGLTAAVLAALALVGGLSYAASSVKNAASAATHITSSHTVAHTNGKKDDEGKKGDHGKGDDGKGDDDNGSADDEYNHCDGDNDGDDVGCKPPTKDCDGDFDNSKCCPAHGGDDEGPCPKPKPPPPPPPPPHKHHHHHHHDDGGDNNNNHHHHHHD